MKKDNKKTRKISSNKKQVGKKKQNNKKLIKQLEKRKKKELKKKLKEIELNQKKEEKVQKKKIKRKLSQKEIEHNRKIKRNIRNLFLIALIITGIILFLLSPIFTIKNVEVEGNESISNEQIVSMLQLQNDTNLFKETRHSIAKKLMENAYIDTVKISRKLPSTLVVKVTERKVRFQLEFGSSYAYIDNEGNILEISTTQMENVRKISGYTTKEEDIKPGNRINDEDISRIKIVNRIIDSAESYGLQEKFTAINIEDDKDFIIYCEGEKKTIHFGDDTIIDTKMLYIKAIMEKENENEGEIFVNMNLNNKNPYFKQKV